MEEKTITIRSVLAGSITLASQQNAVPLIRELSIANPTGDVLENLKLELRASPDFVTQKTWAIDRILPNSEARIRDIDIVLNGQFLNELSEAISGDMIFSLRKNETQLCEQAHSVRLLARNEWGGVGQMADLLAAFSMPNDPAVDKVLKAAALVMERAGKNGALDGYKSGSRSRTWEMVSAIWSAVSGLKLTYALPPASFESQGQKIRTPAQITEVGLATCLDLTLLFAAALEQAGLNPFVVFTKGHAFAGVWLQPEQFSSLLIDSASTIRKRAVLNELVVFETTLATQHPSVSFSQAVSQARRLLSEEEEDKFELAVDLRRARMQKIRPLPAFSAPIIIADGQIEQSDTAGVGLEAAPNLPDFGSETAEAVERETPQTRLAQWQRRLLDLSLRNPLLSYRVTKGSIKLIVPNPGHLEDLLAQGRKIKISAAPVIADGESQRSSSLHTTRHGEDIDEAYAEDALVRDEVLVKLSPDDLDERVTNIYRAAKNDLEEGGANTLFIAIGFLVWQRAEEDRKLRAPLILLPVSLERKSVRGGVRIMLGEDEPRFNTTLLQMLRQDFELDIRGLDDVLPQDEHGVDVAGIWNRVREAIKVEPGFEVVEDVVLGTFSFAKYLMWKDLVDRTDQLKHNPVVNHLIETPREIYGEGSTTFPSQRDLDDLCSPEKVFTPLPSDSSQLAAIMASAAGKDFVLIGPPGTGKSQTIANIIAQNIAEGRKVLFVAEKATALNVVFKRLKKLGLGDFCLELHSNKARKADVLEQLRKAWTSKGDFLSEEWLREASRLKVVRDELSGYVKRIHARYANGLTPYMAMGLVISDEGIPVVKVSWSSPDHHSLDDMDRLRETVDRLEENYRIVSGLSSGGLGLVQSKDWSPAWGRKLIDTSRVLGSAAKNLKRDLDDFLKLFDLKSGATSQRQLDALYGLSQALLRAHGLDLSLAFVPDAVERIEKVKRAANDIEKYRDITGSLSCVYAEFPWRQIDVDSFEKTFNEAEQAFWFRKIVVKYKLSSVLKKKAGAQNKPRLEQDIPYLKQLRDVGGQIEAVIPVCKDVPGWKDYQSETSTVRKSLEVMEALRRYTGLLSDTADGLTAMRNVTRKIVIEANELLDPGASVGRLCSRLNETYPAFVEACQQFNSVACNETGYASDCGDYLDFIEHATQDIQQHEPRLNAWCAWQRAKSDASLAGLNSLVFLLECDGIKVGQTRKVFEKSYAAWWIDAIVEQDAVLRSFVPVEHERRIKTFADLDDKFTELTSKYVRAKLCGGLPSEEDAKRGSELGVLRRELEKKRAHKPLRQLISEMPTALTQIAPCLLMSPLSIAQYLAPDQALFDLVIFDEASQITVWDAIGAISRGRNVIVVGDPQQLPPTTFFNRQEEDGAGDDDVEQDLASILDECLGAGIPQLTLNWHYRSKYESLIAFSNQRFYHGNLVTFPSPITEDKAVRLVPVVDGLYDRGGSQTNRKEAEAIVAEIVSRLHDPVFLSKEQSIGVVTFNSKQQKLIEDLLDAERKKHPELDRFFDDAEVNEPVFVKNLESVQGDERDVMFFSITYGPDKAGAPPKMNFGPLNQQGGSRRLNVAVTRARHEMLVFATLKPEQIDLSKTSASGVRDLKHFLELAERGPRALVEADRGSVGGYESPFEEAVARKLVNLGWQVIPQIGVSTFRIDLGIVHPDMPGRFLAGVECDGATYHRSATVKDRDKLRESVLRGLGWEIVRVWSTDWWIDTTSASQKLHERLTELLSTSRQERVV